MGGNLSCQHPHNSTTTVTISSEAMATLGISPAWNMWEKEMDPATAFQSGQISTGVLPPVQIGRQILDQRYRRQDARCHKTDRDARFESLLLVLPEVSY